MMNAKGGIWVQGLRPIQEKGRQLDAGGNNWNGRRAELPVTKSKGGSTLNRLRSQLLAESYTKRGQDMLLLFERLDENGDGNISYDEMIASINKIVPGLMTGDRCVRVRQCSEGVVSLWLVLSID